MMDENTIIVVVVYNGLKWLEKCLDSTQGYTTIIVDNNSTDESVRFVKENYPNIHLITNSENFGFGKANNIGIKRALDLGGDHIFLLNQDAYIVNDSLDKLIAFQNNNPKFGIVSPIHLDSTKKKMDFKFSIYASQNVAFSSDFILGNPISTIYEVPFVNAAGWLLSRECIEKIGGFDPIFSHYGEDDNFCQRVLYHKFKIGILPQTYIVHDRENWSPNNVEPLSDDYLKIKIREYKVKLGDINRELKTPFQKILNDIQKELIISFMKINIRNFRFYFKLMISLKKIRKDILRSRAINKTLGLHYI